MTGNFKYILKFPLIKNRFTYDGEAPLPSSPQNKITWNLIYLK